jgi:hypothetical protein
MATSQGASASADSLLKASMSVHSIGTTPKPLPPLRLRMR